MSRITYSTRTQVLLWSGIRVVLCYVDFNSLLSLLRFREIKAVAWPIVVHYGGRQILAESVVGFCQGLLGHTGQMERDVTSQWDLESSEVISCDFEWWQEKAIVMNSTMLEGRFFWVFPEAACIISEGLSKACITEENKLKTRPMKSRLYIYKGLGKY